MAETRLSGFWQNVVLPACYSEPVILHASMALANASRWCLEPRDRSAFAGGGNTRLDTVKDYNKAIEHLKTLVTGNDSSLSSLRVILIACAIFIALELCIGRFEKALMHFTEGRKLLCLSPQFASTNSTSAETQTETLVLALGPQSIEDELVNVFSDLDIQSTYFGSEKPQIKLSARKLSDAPQPEPLLRLTLPTTSHAIQEANQYLVILTNECLHFISHKLDPDRHTLQNKVSNSLRQHLHSGLKNWKQTFDRFCLITRSAVSSKLGWRQQSAVMLIHHAWLSIVVPTSYMEIEETDFDHYIQEFTTITKLAASVLPAEGQPPSRFSLEFGLLGALFWTVLKCRHPGVRRMALRLMGQTSREGLWEPKLLSLVGRRCTMLEEGIDELDIPGLLDGMVFYQDDWRVLVPLQRQIGDFNVFFENLEYTAIRMTFERKTWDNNGKFKGMEKIICRQPYEA